MTASKHFKVNEFLCPCCGRGEAEISQGLVAMLEKLREKMNSTAIIITSGYRCNQHDREVGGSGTGMHTKGGACDIVVYKENGLPYDSFTVAECAESIGFTGIGIIDDTACHVDIRGTIPYVNSKWFGNERTNEIYTTFKGMGRIEIVSRETTFACPHCGKNIIIKKGV